MKLVLKGSKTYLKRMKLHLAKEHPKTKGNMRLIK